jgi:hypothetical protein
MLFIKDVDFMLNILPVSDLRNYNEVLNNCQVGILYSSLKIVESDV